MQARDELGVDRFQYGAALASFFAAAALTSMPSGRFVRWVGAQRQLIGALLASTLCCVVVATSVSSMFWLCAVLGVAGAMNAANQTAVNQLLGAARLPRLGAVVALKQSGLPTTSMICGALVPLVAVSFGWRPAYVGAALIAAAAAVTAQRLRIASSVGARTGVARPTSTSTPTRVLVVASVACCALAYTAGALNSWLVESSVEVGWSPSAAGWTLTGAAGFGVVVRLTWGAFLDRLRSPIAVGAGFSLAGAGGIVMLSFGGHWLHLAAAALGFGGAWVWPVFTNFGVLRANPESGGAATGMTQSGVYLGIFLSPWISGWLIEQFGFGAMWLVAASLTACGALLLTSVSGHFAISR